MGMYRDSNWDVPDPGTSHGRGYRMTLHCVHCPRTFSSTSAIEAVSRAHAHQAETGHDISYRGVVQQWAWRQQAEAAS